MKNILISIIILSLLSSCELFEDEAGSDDPNIAAGLKEALRVGTDTAVSRLARVDGYLKDQAVKILLPDEVEEKIAAFKAIEIDIFGLETLTGEEIYNTGVPLLNISSLAGLEDNLITGINRAAESAASEAGPIFFDAITGITIADANNILFGPDDAATTFLRDNTFQSLFNTYEPRIDVAVNSVKVGDQSVESVYNSFISEYNNILSTNIPTGILTSESLASLAGLEQIPETDLSAFATEEGLDGLFLKIEEEEASIREDPLARVTSLLQDVFSLLD